MSVYAKNVFDTIDAASLHTEKSRFAVHVQEHVQLGYLFTASDFPFLCTFHQELRQA